MGKIKYAFLVFMAFSVMAKAQEHLPPLRSMVKDPKNDEYAPKITFNDVIESQVGVVKKVMDLNKEVKTLKKEVEHLKYQNNELQQEISMLKASTIKKSKKTSEHIEVPKNYEELINQAKTWAK